jgi:hypothetical protein
VKLHDFEIGRFLHLKARNPKPQVGPHPAIRPSPIGYFGFQDLTPDSSNF